MQKFLFGGLSILSLFVASAALAEYTCEPESYVYQECDEGKYLVDGQCVGCPTDRIASEVWSGYTGPDSVVDGWDNTTFNTDTNTLRSWRAKGISIGCRFAIPLGALSIDNGKYVGKAVNRRESLFCGLVQSDEAVDYTGVEKGHYVCFTNGGNFSCNSGYQLSDTCFGDDVSECNVHASADTAAVWIVKSLDALSCEHVGDTYYSVGGQLLATQCPAIDAYEVTETEDAVEKVATTIYGVTTGTNAAGITDCHLPADRPNIWYYNEGVGYYSVEAANCKYEEETTTTE